jgi:hypothetical protein
MTLVPRARKTPDGLYVASIDENLRIKIYPGFDPAGYGMVTRCQKLLWLPEVPPHKTSVLMRWITGS